MLRLAIVLLLGLNAATAQIEIRDREILNMGASFEYQGRVIRDVEIPAITRSVGGYCYPRGILIRLNNLTRDEKMSVTSRVVQANESIKAFIVSSLVQAVEESKTIFLSQIVEIIPHLLKYYELKPQYVSLLRIPYQNQTQMQRHQLDSLSKELRLLEKTLFGSWDRQTETQLGGLVTAMDDLRKIMGFSEVLFFDPNTDLLRSRRYEGNAWYDNEITLYFRVQKAVLFGNSKSNIFSTGRFPGTVKSQLMNEIEKYVANQLGIDVTRVSTIGTKSGFSTDPMCTNQSLSPLLDI